MRSGAEWRVPEITEGKRNVRRVRVGCLGGHDPAEGLRLVVAGGDDGLLGASALG